MLKQIFFYKIFILIFAIMFSVFILSCESNEIENDEATENIANSEDSEWKFLEPENFKDFLSGHTRLSFRTSIQKAALYINNEFQGLTPIELNDLIPGDYFIKIKKLGYKTVKAAIQIKDGISDFYYLELELEDIQSEAPTIEDVQTEGISPEEEIPQEELSTENDASPN